MTTIAWIFLVAFCVALFIIVLLLSQRDETHPPRPILEPGTVVSFTNPGGRWATHESGDMVVTQISMGDGETTVQMVDKATYTRRNQLDPFWPWRGLL